MFRPPFAAAWAFVRISVLARNYFLALWDQVADAPHLGSRGAKLFFPPHVIEFQNQFGIVVRCVRHLYFSVTEYYAPSVGAGPVDR